jgi:hypothetical protein
MAAFYPKLPSVSDGLQTLEERGPTQPFTGFSAENWRR